MHTELVELHRLYVIEIGEQSLGVTFNNAAKATDNARASGHYVDHTLSWWRIATAASYGRWHLYRYDTLMGSDIVCML